MTGVCIEIHYIILIDACFSLVRTHCSQPPTWHITCTPHIYLQPVSSQFDTEKALFHPSTSFTIILLSDFTFTMYVQFILPRPSSSACLHSMRSVFGTYFVEIFQLETTYRNSIVCEGSGQLFGTLRESWCQEAGCC